MRIAGWFRYHYRQLLGYRLFVSYLNYYATLLAFLAVNSNLFRDPQMKNLLAEQL